MFWATFFGLLLVLFLGALRAVTHTSKKGSRENALDRHINRHMERHDRHMPDATPEEINRRWDVLHARSHGHG